MRIDIDNYKEYALDYIEQTLSDKSQKEFEIFLHKNPEVSEIIHSLKSDMPTLPTPKKIVYQNKHELKRNHSRVLIYISSAVAACIIVGYITINRNDSSPKITLEPTPIVATIKENVKTEPIAATATIINSTHKTKVKKKKEKRDSSSRVEEIRITTEIDIITNIPQANDMIASCHLITNNIPNDTMFYYAADATTELLEAESVEKINSVFHKQLKTNILSIIDIFTPLTIYKDEGKQIIEFASIKINEKQIK